jgi:hypothetical protein
LLTAHSKEIDRTQKQDRGENGKNFTVRMADKLRRKWQLPAPARVYSGTRVGVSRKHTSQVDATIGERRPF